MNYLIILIFTMISFKTLHAQSGWKDMGGYKETVDTIGDVYQVIGTPDGKYIYSLTYLVEQNKKNLYLQKWSVDSGTTVLSRLIDPKQYYKFYGINLNCDAATYSMSVILLSNPNEYRLIVKDNDTDSILVSNIDKSNNSNGFRQMDYDSVLKCFYYACNSDYFQSSGPNVLQYSNGTVTKKIISGDTLIVYNIVSPNTNKFTHKLGTNVLSVLSNFYRIESKNNANTSQNINKINYIGFLSDKVVNLLEYEMHTYIPFPSYHISLSPNGQIVAATDNKSISTWFIDSSLRSNILNVYTNYSNCLTFSKDNKYLMKSFKHWQTLKS